MNRALFAGLLLVLSLPAFAGKAVNPRVKATKQDTTDDPSLDTYLSPKIDKAQVIDAAGLHQDKAGKKITADPTNNNNDGGMANPPPAAGDSTSTTTVSNEPDGGIVDPKMGKAKKLNGSEITSTGDGSGKSIKIGNDILPITTLHTYDSLRAMPEHQGAHGIARISGPGEAYAVGMMTYTKAEFDQLSKNVGSVAQAMTGHCWGVWSPRVTTDTGCLWNIWISATPGGNPIGPHCTAAPFANNGASGPIVNWFNPNPGQESVAEKNLGGSACELTGLNKRYYCNVITTGWDSQYNPKHCDFIFTGPLSSSAADNPSDQSGPPATFAN